MSEMYFSSAVSVQQLNALYKASHDSGRAAPHDTRCGIFSGRQLLCGARLLRYGEQWLLRNLCSAVDYRRRGLAGQLLQQLPALVDGQPLFTFPLPQLDDFYLRHGFVAVNEKTLQPALYKVLQQSRRRHKQVTALRLSSVINSVPPGVA